MDYLGHRIEDETITPLPKHVKSIEEATEPKDRIELRSFLGICNWLREYVPNFAETAAPLTNCLETKKRWRWTSEAQKAFQRIKAEFSKPLRLHRPVLNVPYVLQTDASGVGLGAVFYQAAEDGKRHIISYSSTKLNATEAKYHVNEQECLALVWAVKKYRPLLEGQHFTVITDSRALTWLNRFKDSIAKLLRWSLLLQEYDFDIIHCPEQLTNFQTHCQEHQIPPPSIMTITTMIECYHPDRVNYIT